MATSKEKKRYHLTATSDGWSDAGSSGMDTEDKLSRAANLQKALKAPPSTPPPRRRP